MEFIGLAALRLIPQCRIKMKLVKIIFRTSGEQELRMRKAKGWQVCARPNLVFVQSVNTVSRRDILKIARRLNAGFYDGFVNESRRDD
jgi:hypothetical protein